MVTDDELSRLAEQAILREAKRGAQRAEISGPSGWLRCRLPSTNKTFLHNTLHGALAANRAKERQDKSRSEDGKRKRLVEEKEKNTYKRLYIHASTKSKNTQPVKNGKSSIQGYELYHKNEKKVDVGSDKVIIWNETGLQLQNFNGARIMNSEQPKSCNKEGKRKTINSDLLPRNINFISSASQDSRGDER
ncbi:uncharacterized protein LOC121860893 [Homarus americanus]|uniref:uncharacterized protein LOC121860893 n=1 Tax=Homarus americanus TaxID=6706 RepID=UPI001C4444C4|nr:uncharacterized protein LOC121860893 [Homarus americanus]